MEILGISWGSYLGIYGFIWNPKILGTWWDTENCESGRTIPSHRKKQIPARFQADWSHQFSEMLSSSHYFARQFVAGRTTKKHSSPLDDVFKSCLALEDKPGPSCQSSCKLVQFFRLEKKVFGVRYRFHNLGKLSCNHLDPLGMLSQLATRLY